MSEEQENGLVITSIYVWDPPWHATMVFDQHGQQMPDYQGPWEKVKDKILKDKPAGVLIQGPLHWRDYF